MNVQQIAFTVPAPQFEALRRRAGFLNIRPTEYAKRLFDAAYYVRCLAEKGEPAEDEALDRQVRQVFLLADCEPEDIAAAIGMPEALVKRILDGWRKTAKDLVAGIRISGPDKAPALLIETPAVVPPPCPFTDRRINWALERRRGRGRSQSLARGEKDTGDRRGARLRQKTSGQLCLSEPGYLPGKTGGMTS